ncbi:MAG: glycosyltransferase [Deltaproteobacteria bacterium]|nr:glycosyltransferase [Deltaproteobacteria bacterium]
MTALRERGHEIIPFSIDYEQNEATPYARYFAPPLGSRSEVYFRGQRKSLGTIARTLKRAFYDPAVGDLVRKLVDDTRPDVAYVLHYLRKLSPSLLVALKEAKIPIVVRLSDYMMLCPQAHFLRGSSPCQECMSGSLLPSIRYRCVQGSTGASLVNAAATWFHRYRGYFELIDAFVVTNSFMLDMMLKAGYREDQLHLIPTFVDSTAFKPRQHSGGHGYVAYVGRLEHTKGVHVLVEAVSLLRRTRPDVGWRFKIAGTGSQAYVEFLHTIAANGGIEDRVDFVGALPADEVASFTADASLQVIPSIWFENLPNSLLESYACGVPVIASDLGSLADAVIPAVTGYKFAAGDATALADSLSNAWDARGDLATLGTNARTVALDVYGKETHLNRLELLFHRLRPSS